MALFTFEVLTPGRDAVSVKTVDLKSRKDVWGHVESAARQMKQPDGALIRVRDCTGGIVVLTGARAALLASQHVGA